MDKKYTISLIALLIALTSPCSFADRPAASEEASQPAAMENDTPTNEYMRPAAEDSMQDTSSMHTETRSTGDVLDMTAAPTTTEAMAQPVKQLDFPRRGMTQDKVQNELGRPIEIVPAVGEPPISRWIYDDRVVYFEYSSVIHVVAK